jgi:hypothetical protein
MLFRGLGFGTQTFEPPASSKLYTKCTLVYGAKAEQKQTHMNDFIFLNETESQRTEMCSIETQR